MPFPPEGCKSRAFAYCFDFVLLGTYFLPVLFMAHLFISLLQTNDMEQAKKTAGFAILDEDIHYNDNGLVPISNTYIVPGGEDGDEDYQDEDDELDEDDFDGETEEVADVDEADLDDADIDEDDLDDDDLLLDDDDDEEEDDVV
jgi:hypothetical protein